MSIASKISKIQTSANDIKTAIIAKGVSVPSDAKLDTYDNYIANITGGASSDEWMPPSDWIDISSVNDNEINLLVGDFNPIVKFTLSVVGGYTVNWGDGVVENFASNAAATHIYTVGAGQACSRGYTTFKIRIYAQTPAYAIQRICINGYNQIYVNNGILWAKLGTTGLFNLNYFLSVNGTPASNSSYVECIELPSSLTSCTYFNYFANGCTNLQKVVMPYTYSSSSINFSYAFANCYSLPKIDYHATTLNVSNYSLAHSYNYALKELLLPTTVNGCTNWTYFLQYCYSLSEFTAPTIDTNCDCSYMLNYNYCRKIDLSGFNNHITNAQYLCSYSLKASIIILPENMPISNGFTNNMLAFCLLLPKITMPNFTGVAITSVGYLFNGNSNLIEVNNFPALNSVALATYFINNCYRLKTISNLDQLGDTTTGFDLANAFAGAYSLETLSIRMKITGRFVLAGYNADNKAALNSLRFTNSASTFAGSSPQVDIRYTSMDATALETVFDDLPNGLSSKTIAITGATGCDTLISKTSCGTTSGSATITKSDTSSLAVGMEATGTGVDTARSIAFTDSGDTVTLTAHGLSNGKKVSFTAITSTTGISINTPYFVVNATTDTFQLSLTEGGAAISLTTDGTGTLKYIPAIVSIVDNTSITLDVPCSATGSVSVSFGILKRSKAILKGWTVTN